MSKITVKINKVLMSFSADKGVFVNLKSNRLNVLYGSNTVGKSILFSSIVAAFGSQISLERIVNNHMVKEDFQIIVDTTINDVNLIVKLKKSSEKERIIKSYEVRVNGEVETFVTTREYTQYILKKIDYPLMSAWDNDGKQIFLSDILLPLYMRQESWKNENLSDSLEFRFKHSNRISTALAYHQGQEQTLFKDMNENIEILQKWLNNTRVNSSKQRILKELNKIATIDGDYSDDKYIEWIALNEKASELKVRIKEIKKAVTKGKIQREIKTEILTMLMDSKYSSDIDELILQKIKNDIDGLMYAVGTDASKTKILKVLENQLFDCKSQLKSSSFDAKIDGVEIPKEIKDFIKNKIKSTKEEGLDDKELIFVKRIGEDLLDLNDRMRSEFRSLAPDNIGFTRGFKITQPGGTKGLKITYEIIKMYKKFTADESTFLLDSIFSEDEGEYEETTEDMMSEKVEEIKKIYNANIRGLVSFVYKEGLKEMMLKEMPELVFIDWTVKKDTKLNTRNLSEEAKEFMVMNT